MEVHVAKTAIKAYFRTQEFPPHSKETMKTNVETNKGHRQVIQEVIENQSLEYLGGPMDHITPERLWNREFNVNTNNMMKGSPEFGLPRLADPGVLVFTDGSQAKDRYTGAGVVITRNNEVMRDQEGTTLAFCFRLKTRNSVYQSEMWAVMKAAQMVADEIRQVDGDPGWITKGETLTIYTDNQATVKALDAIQVKSQLVKDTIDTLNNLSNLLGTILVRFWIETQSPG